MSLIAPAWRTNALMLLLVPAEAAQLRESCLSPVWRDIVGWGNGDRWTRVGENGFTAETLDVRKIWGLS